MATDIGFFTITNPERAEWLGNYPAKDADELATGLIGKITTAGKIDLAGASDSPVDCGFVFTNRTLIYNPTDVYADADEPVTLVRGNVMFLADSTFFVGDTLPSAGDPLYMAASGKMDITGTNLIGKVYGTDDVRAVPNTTKDIVRCEANFFAK